jgi:UDP-GlcNAc:undecaprenyl-phosphate/decaprenyl-phosphate GlcNAc-1-phosphate transferase
MIDVLFSFALTLLGMFLILNTRLRMLAVDKPNARSLHTNVIPRTGGLAIMFGVLVTWLFIGISLAWLLLPAGLVAISLLDDMRDLKARWRFLAQVFVCAAFLTLHPQNIGLWAMPLVLLAMVWMVNLYNFMDGSDGLAGGMAVFGFATYAILAYVSGHIELAMLSSVIASTCLAFLLFNFHPARIFMGDAGSIPLGFLASAIGVWGWQQGLWPFWLPILVFSPFIMDATVTLLKRLLRGERVWLAHKSHYYQRLVQMGWGHRKTAIAEYVLMVMVSVSAILTVLYWTDWAHLVLAIWLLIYIGLMVCIDIHWARHQHLKCS